MQSTKVEKDSCSDVQASWNTKLCDPVSELHVLYVEGKRWIQPSRTKTNKWDETDLKKCIQRIINGSVHALAPSEEKGLGGPTISAPNLCVRIVNDMTSSVSQRAESSY